ncbi:MAG: hypothetical protein IPF66_06725 [Holophagales bacterium]|nr:hypothetical protein [Holophagales bacterium]
MIALDSGEREVGVVALPVRVVLQVGREAQGVRGRHLPLAEEVAPRERVVVAAHRDLLAVLRVLVRDEVVDVLVVEALRLEREARGELVLAVEVDAEVAIGRDLVELGERGPLQEDLHAVGRWRHPLVAVEVVEVHEERGGGRRLPAHLRPGVQRFRVRALPAPAVLQDRRRVLRRVPLRDRPDLRIEGAGDRRAVARLTGDVHPVAHHPAPLAVGRREPAGGIVAPLDEGLRMRGRPGGLADDVDRPAEGVRTGEDRRGPLGDLDPGDVVGRDLREVELAVVRLVVRDAVDEDLDAALVEAVHVDRRLVLAAGRDAQPWDASKRFGDVLRVARLDLLGRYGDGEGRFVDRVGLGRDGHAGERVGLVGRGLFVRPGGQGGEAQARRTQGQVKGGLFHESSD